MTYIRRRVYVGTLSRNKLYREFVFRTSMATAHNSGALWPVTFIVIQLVTNVYYHRAALYRLLGAP